MDRGKLDDSWTVHNGILFFKGTIFLQSTSPLIASILSGFHDDMHEGYQKTLQRVQSEFYWQGMHSTIADYVASCPIYQCNISEHLRPARLLQPLALSTQVWTDISMDFIDGLPKSWGKTVLFVVVDRFSKYAYFLPIAHLVWLLVLHDSSSSKWSAYMGTKIDGV